MAIKNERMQQLRNTAAIWAANDITALSGEFLFETDDPANIRIKIGDGTLAYSALAFVSRRTQAEFDAAVAAYVIANGVDLSAGVADAGKLVLLSSSGLIDSSMLPSTSTVAWNFLGEAAFTGSLPAAPGGTYNTGDVYFNSVTGQVDPTWGWPDDANAAQPGAFKGDLAYYDLDKDGVGVPGWRLIAGEERAMYLIDRDYANDGAAAIGGVPVGGTYHNSGSVIVRTT